MVELDDNDDETALDSLPRVLSVMPDDNFDCSASPDDDDEDEDDEGTAGAARTCSFAIDNAAAA